MADSSAMQEVMSVAQTLALLEGSSPCPPHRRVERHVLLILSARCRQALLGNRGNLPWSEDNVYIQLIIFPVEFNIVQIRHLIPACVLILSTYTWERFNRFLHSCFLVTVIGTRARWLFKNSCVLGKQQAPSCQRNFLKVIIIYWTKYFTVSVTESGPNSRSSSKLLLETGKVMLLYCRLKLYKKKCKWFSWLTVSTKLYHLGIRHAYAINGMIFALFDTKSVLEFDWWTSYFKNWDSVAFS